MDVTTDEPMSGADAVEALQSAGVLDDVLAKIDAGQLQLTGQGWVSARDGQSGAGARIGR
jgi:putative transposase